MKEFTIPQTELVSWRRPVPPGLVGHVWVATRGYQRDGEKERKRDQVQSRQSR